MFTAVLAGYPEDFAPTSDMNEREMVNVEFATFASCHFHLDVAVAVVRFLSNQALHIVRRGLWIIPRVAVAQFAERVVYIDPSRLEYGRVDDVVERYAIFQLSLHLMRCNESLWVCPSAKRTALYIA